MMRVSDYIFEFLVKKGVKDVFMVSGGGSMYLNDAIRRCDGLSHWCFHHEQAATMAAEGYFRSSGKPCCVCVTSGPGSTNTITGVLSAYQDSCPIFIVSGNVRTDTMAQRQRQVGDQEADIISMVKGITKRAKQLTEEDASEQWLNFDDYLDMQLNLAWDEMTSGRQGPVWADCPLDVQRMEI